MDGWAEESVRITGSGLRICCVLIDGTSQAISNSSVLYFLTVRLCLVLPF